MYQPASYLIRFSSSRHCWKHLLLRDTSVLNIRHETTEWRMFIVHQRWHCALGQEPLSQHIGQLWASTISQFLVSFSKKKKHFHLAQREQSRQTLCCNSHNLIFALFSSVAVQREQRKNQEQGNIYKDLSVRSCAESACAQCACVKCSCDFWCMYLPTSMVGACVVCAETM